MVIKGEDQMLRWATTHEQISEQRRKEIVQLKIELSRAKLEIRHLKDVLRMPQVERFPTNSGVHKN